MSEINLRVTGSVTMDENDATFLIGKKVAGKWPELIISQLEIGLVSLMLEASGKSL